MKFKYRKLAVCLLLSFPLLFVGATAEEAYENYSYTIDSMPHAEPQAYLPEGVIAGESLEIGGFQSPQDIFVALDGRIYIADSGNNRIVVLTSDCELERIIDSFTTEDGTSDHFNKPSGLYVTKSNDLYIADTDNSRIVVLGQDGKRKAVFETPDSSLFVTTFRPVKVAVDQYERMFVVSQGCENGLIQLERDGTFSTYFGAIKTTLSAYDYFWRMFQTEEELSRLEKNIPTVYSNCDVDQDGFVYATVSATGEIYDSDIVIRRLNPMGSDILRRDGVTKPIGDVRVSKDETTGKELNSQFVDICTGTAEKYSVLDRVRNRVFTYDSQGNLLYVFGGYGERLGCFLDPSAIDAASDGRFFVTDAKLNHVVIFQPTEYAQLINTAADCQYARRYEEAEANWREVLRYSAKSEVAYNNLGKIMLMSGDRYDEAAFCFKLGNAKELYSSAFKYQRRDFLNNYFSYGVILLVVILIAVFVLRFLLKRRAKKQSKGKD